MTAPCRPRCRPGEPKPSRRLDRDDRGPGQLPEPREYDVPPAPVAVEDAPALVPSGDPEAPPQAEAEARPP